MKTLLIGAVLALMGTVAHAEPIGDACEIIPFAPWCQGKAAAEPGGDACDIVPQAPWCQNKVAEPGGDVCEIIPQAPWCKPARG